MRRFRGHRLWSILIAVSAMMPARFSRADDPPLAGPASSTTSTVEEADEVLRHALDFERKRNWSAAIEVYEFGDRALAGGGISSSPATLRDPLQARQTLSRSELSRRAVAIAVGASADLHDEVLDRIQSQYVESVALEPLLRRGLDNLEVALRDPAFLRVNAPQAVPEAIKALRDTLVRALRSNLARDRTEARSQVCRSASLPSDRWGSIARRWSSNSSSAHAMRRRLFELPHPRPS